jgi:aspartate aminotransferase-like enzyme
VEWGEALDLSAFENMLKQNLDIKTVFTQACETSTATLHPVGQMSALVRKHLPDSLFAVDAITAVGCMELPMDKWGVDIMVGGSQKAFMIPTGLSFIALSERAWKRQPQSLRQKFYLDLAGEARANAKGDSQFSIPTPLMTGLGVVLAKLREPTRRTQLKQRCALLANITRDVGIKLGLSVYSQSPSSSVTALLTSVDSSALRDRLEKEFNITVMGGQDKLKGKILRVGHMGDVRDDDMLAFFEALSECLGKSGEWNQIKLSTKTRLGEVPALFS